MVLERPVGAEFTLVGFENTRKTAENRKEIKKEKRKKEEEKRRKKRKKEKKRGDGLYLKGAPQVRHAPTREARKIFWPFLVTRF